MEVILLSDVEKLGLRGEVVDVARGYARNYLLPRRLAENATPARVAELPQGRRRAREARGAHGRAGAGDRRAARQDRAPLRGQGRPDRVAVRLGDAVRHRRRDLAHTQGPRRPAQDRDRPAQADRPLRGADRALPGRARRGEDARRTRGRGAAARGGARGDRGAEAEAAEAAAEPLRRRRPSMRRPRRRSRRMLDGRGGRRGGRRRGRRRGLEPDAPAPTDEHPSPTAACTDCAQARGRAGPAVAAAVALVCVSRLPRRDLADEDAGHRHRGLDHGVVRLRAGGAPLPRQGPRPPLRRGRLPSSRRGELLRSRARPRPRRSSSSARRAVRSGRRGRDQRGYNDWAAVYDVDRVDAGAARPPACKHGDLGHPARGDVELRQSNARIRTPRGAAEEPRRRRLERVQQGEAVVPGGRPAPHDVGAFGLARLLRPLVLADASSCPQRCG